MKQFQFKLQVPPEEGAPVRGPKGETIGRVLSAKPALDDDVFIVTVEVDESSPVVQKLIEGLRADTSIGASAR